MKISDLQSKTIINVSDGKDIGRISDLEIDSEGKVICFYALPKRSIFRMFIGNKESIFKIDDIKKIGSDVILVELG